MDMIGWSSGLRISVVLAGATVWQLLLNMELHVRVVHRPRRRAISGRSRMMRPHSRAYRLTLSDVQRIHLARIRDSWVLIGLWNSGTVIILLRLLCLLLLRRRRRYSLPIGGCTISIIDSRRRLIDILLLEVGLLIIWDISAAVGRHRARISGCVQHRSWQGGCRGWRASRSLHISCMRRLLNAKWTALLKLDGNGCARRRGWR